VNRREAIAKLVFGSLLAAGLSFFLAGCSEVGFPAVHDMPSPRADTPLTPDQVKEATDSLVSQREHLQSIPPIPPPVLVPQKTSLQAPVTPSGTRTAGTDDNGQ
jgi:hypothetical protein